MFQLLPAPTPEPLEEITELRIIRHAGENLFTVVDPQNGTAAAQLTVDECLGAIARSLFHPDRKLLFGTPIAEVIERLAKTTIRWDRKPMSLAIVTILRELEKTEEFPTPPLAFLSARHPL